MMFLHNVEKIFEKSRGLNVPVLLFFYFGCKLSCKKAVQLFCFEKYRVPALVQNSEVANRLVPNAAVGTTPVRPELIQVCICVSKNTYWGLLDMLAIDDPGPRARPCTCCLDDESPAPVFGDTTTRTRPLALHSLTLFALFSHLNKNFSAFFMCSCLFSKSICRLRYYVRPMVPSA